MDHLILIKLPTISRVRECGVSHGSRIGFYDKITNLLCFVSLLQESVMECYNVIQDIAKEEYESMFNVHSSSGTPVNVLDENFLSLESEKTNGTNVSHTTMIQEKHFKRRKI